MTRDFFHSPPHILENVSIWYISYISNLITKTPVTPGDTQYPIMLNVTLSHRSYSLVCEQNDEVVVYPVEQLTFSVKSLCLCAPENNYKLSSLSWTPYWAPTHTHTHLNISWAKMPLFTLHSALWSRYFNQLIFRFQMCVIPQMHRKNLKLYVYPCERTVYSRKCLAICCTLKILVNFDLTVCGSSLKISALLQSTLSAAKD